MEKKEILFYINKNEIEDLFDILLTGEEFYELKIFVEENLVEKIGDLIYEEAEKWLREKEKSQ